MSSQAEFMRRVGTSILTKQQYYLDKTVIQVWPRWISFAVMIVLFAARIYQIEGFFVVAYAYAIFLLNQFLAFLSPRSDPATSGPLLPTKSSEEYRPFQRQLSEFVFWKRAMSGVLLAFVATFIPIFNIPVFWPVLVLYFMVLFFFTMKRQVAHMIKYRYIPISWGKRRYGG